MRLSRFGIWRAIRGFSPRLPHYLFAAVFLLRLVTLVRLSKSPLFLPASGDMHFYNEWAQRVLRGEVAGPGAFYGLPLYPYLLALLYKLFGFSPFVPALIQVALDAGTAVLIYQLTLHLITGEKAPAGHSGDRLVAVLAAVAWAFYVPAQAYAIILMPTAWYVFVFWLIVWRIVKAGEAPGIKECLLLGLLIGITAMGIATILFLVPLVFAALAFKPVHHRIRRIAGAAVLIGVCLGTSPCWVHNYFVARDPVFLSAHGGVNFWIGNNPTANGYPRFPPGLRAGQAAMLEDSITSAETAAGHPLKRSEVSAYWSAQAKNYIAQHFGDWLRLVMLKFRNFWSAFQYDDLSIVTNFREQGIVLPGLYFGLISALAIPGIFIGWWSLPVSRWITGAIMLQMIALLTVFITERYRLPVVPGLLVLGAFGLKNFWRSCVFGLPRQAALYLVMLAAAVIFVSWPQRSPSLWALDAYNSGWQALESGDLRLAEEKLSIARRYVPTNPETNFALGNLRLAQNDNAAAFSFYKTTLKFDHDHRGALNNLAVMAFDASRYELAEKWLRHAESLDPRNAKTHFLLAKTLLAKGDRRAAQLEIESAIRLRPAQREFEEFKRQIEATGSH
ncbi:MAG: hypothetical protein QOG67_956 [Verrucomicrobiota bacterium]|jgi:hypothetical protein